MTAVLEAVWQAVNSPAGIAAAAAIAVWLLARLYRRFPTWARYEGVIAKAVRFAERTIPDATGNTGLRRLDAALKYVLRVYGQIEGREPPKGVVRELREAIQVKHAELEAAGELGDGAAHDAG